MLYKFLSIYSDQYSNSLKFPPKFDENIEEMYILCIKFTMKMLQLIFIL